MGRYLKAVRQNVLEILGKAANKQQINIYKRFRHFVHQTMWYTQVTC